MSLGPVARPVVLWYHQCRSLTSRERLSVTDARTELLIWFRFELVLTSRFKLSGSGLYPSRSFIAYRRGSRYEERGLTPLVLRYVASAAGVGLSSWAFSGISVIVLSGFAEVFWFLLMWRQRMLNEPCKQLAGAACLQNSIAY